MFNDYFASGCPPKPADGTYRRTTRYVAEVRFIHLLYLVFYAWAPGEDDLSVLGIQSGEGTRGIRLSSKQTISPDTLLHSICNTPKVAIHSIFLVPFLPMMQKSSKKI